MSSRFSKGTVQILDEPSRTGSSTKTLPRVLGGLVLIFVITTIVFATFYGLEKGKKTDDTATTVPVSSITTTPVMTPSTSKIESSTTIVTTSATPIITSTADPQQNLCLSPYCIKAADYLIESIDESADPCENFFQFVCGTWVKNTRIPDDAGAQNTFNLLRNQLDYNVVDLLSQAPTDPSTQLNAVTNAQNLYRSCINEAAIDQEGANYILSLVDTEFGGWPILQGLSWNNESFNFIDLIMKLRQYNQNLLFRVLTATDDKNSTSYDIELGQGDLGLESKDYYKTETPTTIAYRQFMRDLAKALATDTSMIEQDVTDMYEFEQNIAQYHWTASEQRERENETVRTNLAEVQTTIGASFDFETYVRRAYLIGNITLTDEDIVSLNEIKYLRNVSMILEQTPIRTLQNYLVWRFMMNRAGNLPQSLRAIRERFIRVFRGTTAEPPRTVSCGNLVNSNMGFAVSKVYIKAYFDENARNQSFEMITNIRNSFISMVNESTWMDEVSKAKAIEKALAIDQKIGYPDYLASDNNTKLEADYAEYQFGTSFGQNVLKLIQIKARENFRALREPVDRTAWGDEAPSVVNAFYEPARNQITFPAGILQKPFFDKDAPKYLNYGGIGVVIGHEITHGFDDDGRQFDKNGNRIPWWTNETIAKFNERKTCIVNQYSNYTAKQVNMTLNGFQTQGEDIADNGGLRESYFAYEKWVARNGAVEKRLPGLQQYTPEQMFFINYAHTWCTKMTDAYARNRIRTDVHSLGEFRAIGPPSNFDQFDRAFGCTPGQSNSRVDKCIVW